MSSIIITSTTLKLLSPDCSFFPQTIRDWNSLTDTFLSAAEGAEDSVAKFTSLVRARD